ncbi:hypothetical protein L0F63_007020 [Massospora cicadina]|nr:hypothetical protein L0F63_007020 [Massospora cicadina]
MKSGFEATDIPTINASECTLVFQYKKVYYSGCTDADSKGKPWCLLKRPVDGQLWGYCNLTTIYTYLADDQGNKHLCEYSTLVNGSTSAFGCYSIDAQMTYSCMSEGKELNCVMGGDDFRRPPSNPYLSLEPETTRPSPNTKLEPEDETTFPLIVLLSIGIGLSLALFVGLVLIRRARSQEASNSITQNTQVHIPDSKLDIGSTSKLQFHAPNKFEHSVVTSYTPTLSDELIVYPGDKVVIFKEYDDGWVQGTNLTRGGTRGVFPKHCILPLNYITNHSRPTSKRSSSTMSYRQQTLT